MGDATTLTLFKFHYFLHHYLSSTHPARADHDGGTYLEVEAKTMNTDEPDSQGGGTYWTHNFYLLKVNLLRMVICNLITLFLTRESQMSAVLSTVNQKQ